MARRIEKMLRSDGFWTKVIAFFMIWTIGIGWLAIGSFAAAVFSSPDWRPDQNGSLYSLSMNSGVVFMGSVGLIILSALARDRADRD